jgi:hypothetical protein
MLIILPVAWASANDHAGHGSNGRRHFHPPPGPNLWGPSGGWRGYGVPSAPVYLRYYGGPILVFPFSPPPAFFGPMPLAQPMAPGPLDLAAPPLVRVPNGVPAARRRTLARAQERITLGDRLFRAGNLPRAVERYEQALRDDPDSAIPRVRLAQVALFRARYAEAAELLREAQTAQPRWLEHPPDVQVLYPEPGDFARQIARLESHLQAHPNDRDAWLVLGAQWYLSGRTHRAADVFLRLTDRKPDDTLAAFLKASRADERPVPAAEVGRE